MTSTSKIPNSPLPFPQQKLTFLFFGFLLLLMSSLLALGIAEGFLQILNFPKQSWSPWIEDNHTGFRYASFLNQRMVTEEYNVSINTNEAGFRDDALGPKRGKRILLLGDSFTFGYGVDRPYIFADLLEKDLGIEVLNASTGGFDLIHQVQWVKYNADKYSPNLMVYMLYLGNDLVGNWKWELQDKNLKASHRPTVRSHWDIKLLTLLKILRHRLAFRHAESKKWQLPKEYLALTAQKLSPEALKDYQFSQRLLSELADEVKKKNIPFMVVLIPYKTMVEAEEQAKLAEDIKNFSTLYDLERPSREVRGWLKEKEIPFYDLTPDLKKISNQQGRPLYYAKDGHFNNAGHEAVSLLLAKALRQKYPMVRDAA